MNTKSDWLVLTSASYFTCWFVLVVVYHLSGWAQVSGGAMSLWAISNILSSWQINLNQSLN
jgi:hypothetical protein